MGIRQIVMIVVFAALVPMWAAVTAYNKGRVSDRFTVE